MKKQCSKCGEVKDIRKFRYIRAQRGYSDCCRNCESVCTKEDREKNRRVTLKVQIKKNWTELCQNMSQCEVDQQLYNLKEIYKQVQQEKAKE